MSVRPARVVSATCPCGAVFDREVKRGRPQVWCPACLAVPFYERNRAVAPAVDGVPTVSAASKSQWDRLAHVREQIEAEVVAANSAHKARFEALVAEGGDPWEISPALQARLAEDLRAIYAQYGGGVYADSTPPVEVPV